MSCCSACTATARHFSAEVARGDLEKYRRKGPNPTTRSILTAIRDSGVSDATLLDIGAGIGVLQHELLGNEVTSAIYVEALPAYLEAARQESEARGHSGRVRFVQGDFVEVCSELPEADIVALDRVICCYADGVGLVEAAASRARQVFVCSVPLDRWFVRCAVWWENWLRRARRNDFRTYVHRLDTIAATLENYGFRQEWSRHSLAWQTMLHRRQAGHL